MSNLTPPSDTPKADDEFWRRTPPALFPTVLGLLGLGLAWRAAAVFAPDVVSFVVSDIILATVCMLQLFVLACYLSKVSVRPSVVLEDMKSVPGRAGVSAITMGVLLFAAALQPYSSLVASAALFIALPLHCLTTFLALWIMFRTKGGLVVSPAWHLSFVGFIVAALSAIPLGYIGLAQTILGLTVLASAVIYGVSLLQMNNADVPPPIRPLLAIHLAPLSLFATVASLLNLTVVALIFGTLAMGVAGVLLSRARYLGASGFSPFWGAFTFPVAAFSSALFALSTQVGIFGWLAFAPLVVASLLTPFIAIRLIRMWSTGALATKTGAAVA